MIFTSLYVIVIVVIMKTNLMLILFSLTSKPHLSHKKLNKWYISHYSVVIYITPFFGFAQTADILDSLKQPIYEVSCGIHRRICPIYWWLEYDYSNRSICSSRPILLECTLLLSIDESECTWYNIRITVESRFVKIDLLEISVNYTCIANTRCLRDLTLSNTVGFL